MLRGYFAFVDIIDSFHTGNVIFMTVCLEYGTKTPSD